MSGKSAQRAEFIRHVLQRNYTHGETCQSTIRLYYQEGRRRRYVDIPQSKCPWYFYVLNSDFTKYRNTFKCLKDDGLIIKVRPHGKEYQAVYCRNNNLPEWKLLQGEEDHKNIVLRTIEPLGIKTFETDLSPLDRFLIDHDVQIEDDYYIGYFDIETDDRKNDFTPGCQRILSMAVIDNFGKKWYMTSKNEEKLLLHMVKVLRRFSIIVGYNSKRFDLPYIKARCDLYGIPFYTDDMIHIDLWARLDDLYRYDKEGPSAFKLDDISLHFLDEQKIQFDNDKGFWWNWLNNSAQFKEYNIKDTVLLKRIDEKIDAIRMMVLQAKLCGIFLNKFWNTRLTDMYLLRVTKRRGMALPNKKEHIKIQMPGGRVRPIIPGLYENVEVWDFAQMYSTIMRSLNISPETLRVFSRKQVRQLERDDRLDAYHVSPIHSVVKLAFHHIKRYAKDAGHALLTEPGDWTQFTILGVTELGLKAIQVKVLAAIQESLTLKSLNILRFFIKTARISRSDDTFNIQFTYNKQVFFKKAPRSLVGTMLQAFVDKRNEAKAKMKQYEEDIPEYKLWKAYNLAYKLMGNVTFGYMSSNKTRCYSHPIACSITLCGQTIINLIMKGTLKRFSIPTIYSDTDSVFLSHPEKPKKLAEFGRRYYKWFVKYIRGALKHYFNVDNHCMDIEAKLLYDKLLLIKKKNYIGWTEEGDKFEPIGIDYIKRSTIPYTKVLQKELVEGVIKDPEFRDIVALRQWAKKQQKKFFDLPINPDTIREFVIHTRISKEAHEYKTDPVHVRIVQKMLADGEQFFTGGVLKYVIIEDPGKKIQGEEVNRFIANSKLHLDKKRYWSNHIYSKLRRILDAVHPDEVWETFNPEDEKMRQQRIVRYKKGIADPKRIQKSLGLMMKAKVLHPTDKKAILKWAHEKGYISEAT